MIDVSSTNSAMSALGSSVSATTNGQQLAHAFVDYFNKHGGISGRKLEPVEYTINATDNSYETDTSAACAKFTQDNHVTLALSQLGDIFSGNYETCLTKAGVTDLNIATGIPDDRSIRAYPRYYSIAVPTINRRETAVFKGLAASGLFTPSTKIGLLVEDCPENLQAYRDTVQPLIAALHLDVQKRDVSCLGGFGQVGSWLAEVQATVLPFRSAGVNRVTFMSAWESTALTGFEGQANSQAYQPQYGLSSNAGMAVFASTYTASQNARMHGVGWLPIVDTTGIPQNVATRRCLSIARSEGINATSQTDVGLVYLVCEQFLVFERVLAGAGGRDDAASLQAGLASVSTGFVSALELGGEIHLSNSVHDATKLFSRFDFNSGCGCFRYTGKPQALA